MRFRLRSTKSTRQLSILSNAVTGLLLVFFAFYCVDTWRKTRAHEFEMMDSISVLMAHSLNAYFHSKEAGIKALASDIERTPGGIGNLKAVQRLLNDYTRTRPELLMANLVDMKGQVLATTTTSSLTDLPNIADQLSFQTFLREAADKPGLDLSRAQLGKLSGRWSISMRYILRDRDGRALVHISAVLPVDFLASLWRDAPAISQMTAGVMRDDGYLMSRYPVPDGGRLGDVFATPRSGALIHHLRENEYPERGVIEGVNTFAGEDYVNVYRRLEDFPITAFVAQPSRQILGAWWTSIRIPSLLLLVLIIGTRLAARYLRMRELRWDAERTAAEQAMRRSEQEQRFLIDRLMTGLVVHDATGAVVRCNRQATELLGLNLEQMAGKRPVDPSWKFLQEDGTPMRPEQYPAVQVLANRQPVTDLVAGILRPEMTGVTWVLCRADPYFDAEGQLTQVVVTFIDITLRLRYQIELQDKEQRIQAMFDNSIDAVLQIEPAKRILAANQSACRMFRLSEAELLGRNPMTLVDTEDPRLAELMAERKRTGKAIGMLTMVRGDGSRFTAEVSSSLYTDADKHLYGSMIVRDISERLKDQAALEAANREMHRVNTQLMEIAHFDTLTRLPNRVLLADRLQQAIAHSTRRRTSVAVVFLDLDGFKEVNDQYGHSIGDKLLVAVAARLKSVLRDGDTLARIGGDEFVAVLTDLPEASACEPMVRRLLHIAAEPMLVEEKLLRVSASIGVTIFPLDGSSPEQLIRHADQAMYVAKQSGKNRFHLFDVASDQAIRTRRESLDEIFRAFQRREFVLYYQPQVNLRTGQLVGVEALLRWRHPQRGLLQPGAFLPIIADQEIAIDIGEMVLDMALAQMDCWQREGMHLPVSVNLFPLQLQKPDFVRRLQGLLDRYPEVSPHKLELEILETNALDDIALVSELMASCLRLGVRFAIDDFGTGYSSLTYLKNLPADLLKIDQSFVRDILVDHDDLAIVQGIIGLSKAFNRRVIAEGVETLEIGRELVAMGCELAQGYGIARPIPAEELPAWQTRWLARQLWLGEGIVSSG